MSFATRNEIIWTILGKKSNIIDGQFTVFYKKAVLKNFANFTGKHLRCKSYKVAGPRTPFLKNICRWLLLNLCEYFLFISEELNVLIPNIGILSKLAIWKHLHVNCFCVFSYLMMMTGFSICIEFFWISGYFFHEVRW